MHDCATAAQWYAIRTSSGRERVVSSVLRHKGYEEFLPTYRIRRQWSDRIKELERPLFPGYLFCRFVIGKHLPILITSGVQLIVGCGRTPVPVRDEEIESLRCVVEAGAAAAPCPYLEVGQRVEIREGPLTGVRGILLQIKNSWRIVLSVELLRRSVSVEVDRTSVEAARHDGNMAAESAAAAASAGYSQFGFRNI